MPVRPSVFAAAAVLLVLMFVLAGGAALRESVTIDEVAHIGAGLSYVQKLDLRFNDEHPPLAKVLAGLSLAMHGTRADYSSVQWTFGKDFFPAYMCQWIFGDWVLGRWNNAQSTLVWARLPMLLLTLLLGWVLFLLGRRLGGDWGGLLCLAAYTSMPMFLAFGPLVLTDAIIALFTVLTLWALGELWRNPDRRNTRWFALALAGALLSKFSSGILVIAIVAFVLSTRWWALADQPAGRVEARPWRKLRWRALRKGTLLAAVVVYVVYFVFSWNQPLAVPGFAGHGPLLAIAGRLLMPPWLFLRGLAWVLLGAVRPTFLFGHPYPHGIWFFYPVLLVLKSLPGFLGLLVLTLALSLWHRRKSRGKAVVPAERGPHWRAIWVSLLVFVVVCLIGTMDISIRHFSVPLALLTLLLAPLPRLIERCAKSVAWGTATVTALLVASCLVTSVRLYPYYFPYVSPFGMGRPLYWLMSDSNVDWNQALPEVQQFAQQHALPDVPMDIYGFSDSRTFVPRARLWDCQAPADSDAGRWVFVSSNMILDSHNCGWIMQYPHQALADGGMYAIRLPSPIPAAGGPGGPPLPAARRVFLNMPFDMRVLFLDLSEHPDRIQKTMDDMMAKYQKEMEEAKRKKGQRAGR
jgi:4-amino-4-deoxy-L-arabinose transferase-like glycosyltransferase